MKKEIYVGADHAGFALKESIKEWFLKKGYRVYDVGAHFYRKEDDYPEFAKKLGEAVVRARMMGVLVCGSGEGVCIAANKVRGVRAVAAFSPKVAQLSREHNDANVLCLSGWNVKENEARRIIEVFLKTRFSGLQRHVRRVKMIQRMEG